MDPEEIFFVSKYITGLNIQISDEQKRISPDIKESQNQE